MLQAWTRSGALQEQVWQIKCRSGLNPACNSGISRDAPYAGLKFRTRRANISTSGWTPFGYMGSFKICATSAAIPPASDEYWKKDSTAELYHFIGKDIVYFPQPVLACHAGRQQLPQADQPVCSRLCDGERREDVKSRGTFIKASTAGIILTPTACVTTTLRNSLRALMIIDLNLEGGFVQRVNADIVNKVD